MKRRMFRPVLSGALAAGSAMVVTGGTMMGCLDRPIEPGVPNSSARIVEIVPNSRVTKIDLLLGIDNSASMADKQQILAQAVPDLVERLVNPQCIDEAGQPLAANMQPARPEQDCPAGSRREFSPVFDIHIGIVSSSLGAHGGDVCPDQLHDSVCGSVSQNDHGQLVARENACSAVNDLPTYQNKGFLAWDPLQVLMPPGEKNLGTLDGSEPGLIPSLAEMVRGVSQRGCGYESQLESIYRFLVDPDPYQTIEVVGGKAQMQGTDTALLAQRAAFLRPDSLVAVLMLSDENDCSMREGGQYYLAANSRNLPAARAVCAERPNDPCCTSCAAPVPAGCPVDPTCIDKNNNLRMLNSEEDPINLRCFDQKRRFGFDFLHPTDRYINAFKGEKVPDREGNLVDNPLFPAPNREAGLVAPRTKDMFFLAGIVGVPWQDIAKDPKDLSAGFKTSGDMEGDGTWKLILGNAETGEKARDPLMHESVGARAGIQPITGEPLDLTPESPRGNSINGHERNTHGEDLQYACIFELPKPSSCGNDSSCECFKSGTDNPLCDADKPNTLVRAKAYPSVRQLQVIEGLHTQGIVASVCPQQMDNNDAGSFGYRAAIGALVDQLKNKINGPCLPRTLESDAKGQVNCVLLEARNAGGKCDCDANQARREVSSQHRGNVEEMKKLAPGNDWDCFCEVPQLKGDDLIACQSNIADNPVTSSGASVDGYCYIDAVSEPAVGNPIHVAACPENERRRIRLVGKGEPAIGATLGLSCFAER